MNNNTPYTHSCQHLFKKNIYLNLNNQKDINQKTTSTSSYGKLGDINLYSRESSDNNYILYYTHQFLRDYWGFDFTERARISLSKIALFYTGSNKFITDFFKKNLNISYYAANRLINYFCENGILYKYKSYHSIHGKQDVYKLTLKVRQFFENTVGKINNKIKIDKTIEKDYSLSWQARILFSVIDNNCNEKDIFYYNQDKLNKWLANTKSSSQTYHKVLLRELEAAGYIEKVNLNEYKLIKRSYRKPKTKSESKLQTNNTTYYFKNKKYSLYKYNSENSSIDFYSVDIDKEEFQLAPKGNPFILMSDYITIEHLNSKLDELHINDFIKLLLEVYGCENSKSFWYPIRSYVQNLINGFAVTRADLVLSAFIYQNNDKKYKMTIISWLKKGCVFNLLMQKNISSKDIRSSEFYNICQKAWQERYYQKDKRGPQALKEQRVEFHHSIEYDNK